MASAILPYSHFIFQGYNSLALELPKKSANPVQRNESFQIEQMVDSSMDELTESEDTDGLTSLLENNDDAEY